MQRFTDQDRLRIVQEPGTDREIAERYGIARKTVCKWRNRLGLPHKGPATRDEVQSEKQREDFAIFRRTYALGVKRRIELSALLRHD